MIHNSFLRRNANLGIHTLLKLTCYLIVVLGGLLAPSIRDAHSCKGNAPASQKDKIIEVLFRLEKGTADDNTEHDYNDYECHPHYNLDECDGYYGGHTGWDVQTKQEYDRARNENFYSLTRGIVIRADSGNADNPSVIAVYSETDIKTTLYLHARSVYVKKDDEVEIGDRLGAQGNTGMKKLDDTTGSHVHIEVRSRETTRPSCGITHPLSKGNPTKDPIPYLFQSINTTTDPAANPVTSKTTYEGHRGDVNSVAFSPDGRTIASGSDDDDIFLWDTITGQHTQTLKRHTSRVNSVVFSPDGGTIASGSDDDDIFLWNAITGQHRQTLKGHSHDVNSVVFSPDGGTIASGSDDDDIFLWNVITGRHTQTLEGHTRNVNSVAFSPDGRTIVSGDDGNNIFLWDAITGEHTQTLEGHTDEVTSVAFSPDGRTIVSGSADNNIFLWNAITGEHTQTLEGHTDEVNSIAFSPNGGTIVSGSDDDNIFLWDTITDKHIQTLEGHTSRVKSVAFSPDGRTIVSGSDDETVRFWKPTSLLAEAGRITELQQLDEDINGDGSVNIQDLVLVAWNFGQTGQNAADVNSDSVVNIADLILVAGAIVVDPRAPSAWGRGLDATPTFAEVQQWLREARQMNLADPAFQRGILMLEQLLAMLTPKETTLLPNYPNPFNPETWIPYQLAKSANVNISIYAVDGKLVRTLDLGYQPMGIYEFRSRAAYWDGKNELGEPVASGVYFYTLTAGDFNATRKMLIMK